MPDSPGELVPEGGASYTPGTPGGITPEGGGAATPGDPGNLTPSTPAAPEAPPSITPETPPSVPAGAQWATQDQAEAGTSSNTLMSPIRTKQAIQYVSPVFPQHYGVIGAGDDTAAIQAALNIGGHVKIPYKSTPYLISDRLVIKSGTWLDIDFGTVIREIAGNNVVMIINENPAVDGGDHDIKITGGYWDVQWALNPGTTLWSSYSQLQSNKDPDEAIKGIAGIICLIGVTRAEVTDLTIKNPVTFGIQMSQCNDWRVERIRFERTENTISDGVHVNGPSSNFVINDIRGATGDDFIALNAWDWIVSTPNGVFGTIEKGTISNLRPNPCKYGVIKIQIDGSTDTKVQDVVIENVTGFSEGPGLLWGVLGDAINPENVATHGEIKNVTVRNVTMGNSGSAPPFPYRGYLVTLDVTLTNIKIINPVIDDQFHAAATHIWAKIDLNCILDGFTVEGMNMSAINPRSSIFEIGGQMHDVNFINCKFLGDGTGTGEQAYSPFTFANGTSSSQRVSFLGCRFEGLSWLFYIIGAATDLHISMEGSDVIGCGGIIFAGSNWNADLLMTGNRFSLTNGWFNFAASAPTLFVRTQGNIVYGSAVALPVSAGSYHWDGVDIPINYEVITPSEGDWINNINSSGGTVPTGRVKRSGGAWVAL